MGGNGDRTFGPRAISAFICRLVGYWGSNLARPAHFINRSLTMKMFLTDRRSNSLLASLWQSLRFALAAASA
jgi:hypothetical protein